MIVNPQGSGRETGVVPGKDRGNPRSTYLFPLDILLTPKPLTITPTLWYNASMINEQEAVTLTFKPSACMRTKNRLREHGLVFTVRKISQSCISLNGQRAVLVSAPDGWFGWLPLTDLNEESLLLTFS